MGWLAVGVLWAPGSLLYWPFWGGDPGVDLALAPCCFVVCSAWRFVLCLVLCYFVLLFFFSPFDVAVASLGEERANLSAFRTFV